MEWYHEISCRNAKALLALTVALLGALFFFTLGNYYGYYYDNKFFNLLALELWEDLRPVIYLGSHYHVPSSLYSYMALPFFYVLGPGDLAMEVPAAAFHILTVLFSYLLGSRWHGRTLGVVFAIFVALSPIHLVQVYTLPDLSFAVFLNVLAMYLFLTGLETSSFGRSLLGGVVYALGCFQAIYSLLLLPFYAVYSVISLYLPLKEGDGGVKGSRLRLGVILYLVLSLPAFAYLVMLAGVSFLRGKTASTLLIIIPIALAAYYAYRKKRGPGLRRVAISFSFLAVSAALLLYFDLIVQLDYILFDHAYGYYLDASVAGGYGGRPVAHYLGRELKMFGYPVRMSVLTSLFEFVGKDFARVSLINTDAFRNLYVHYFLVSYPWHTRLFFALGVLSFLSSLPGALREGMRKSAFHLFPLLWLLTVIAPIADLGPSYFNIRRIYIPPLPSLFAAFGVMGTSRLIGYTGSSILKPVGATLFSVTAVLLALTGTAGEARFTYDNIFLKYDSDKRAGMYYKLYYGHFYGRGYAEAGEFLLRDAPRKNGGPYRAALVYTIPEDSKIGRSLPLYNTINWYTRNELMVIYAFKRESARLYGTGELLKGYLDALFTGNPSLEAVYFADFVDTENGFSYFSKVHPGIKPYAIADDDGVKDFDCVLFKFERGRY